MDDVDTLLAQIEAELIASVPGLVLDEPEPNAPTVYWTGHNSNCTDAQCDSDCFV